jgi:hypothetical protein
MAVKDRDKHFPALSDLAAPVQVSNTVSRNLKTGDRSYSQVVFQSGKPVLDSELNLEQSISEYTNKVLGRAATQSGFFKGHTHKDSYEDFFFVVPGMDSSEDPLDKHIGQGVPKVDAFCMRRIEATVAGFPIIVEYTNTDKEGWNLVQLEPAQQYDGTPDTWQRCDFVFLEVWQALVAPSIRASATVMVEGAIDHGTVGDKLTLTVPVSMGGDGLPHDFNLVAQGTTGVPTDPNSTDFEIDATGNDILTAKNLSEAINNAGLGVISTNNNTNIVTIKVLMPGVGGDGTTISWSFVGPSSMATLSGPTFSGGRNSPNKPQEGMTGLVAQDKIWRHGNVDSPEPVWLEDDLADPVIDVESTERVQVQYRLRATSNPEGINWRKHPDGFSNNNGGLNTVNAQGGRDAAQTGYKFVPADGNSIFNDGASLKSSAAAFGTLDDGLWIAGTGSEEDAQNLNSVDGFVYAIPIGFVYRRNDAFNTVSTRGFDPINNANGALTHNHEGPGVGVVNTPLGDIPDHVSDRPDGAFCDVINKNDILDLRRHVTPMGYDLASELQYQMQSLLDGNYRTWAIDSEDKSILGSGSGDVSTRHLVCNEFGRSAEPGIGGISGTTGRGKFVREFDHICRRFGDQPVVERVVFAFYPSDVGAGVPVAPGTVNQGKYVEKSALSADRWCEGDVLHLNLSALDATTTGLVFQGGPNSGPGDATWGNSWPVGDVSVKDFNPEGTVITDILSIYHDDGHYTEAIDQRAQANHIEGLGTEHLKISLGRNRQVANGGAPGPDYLVVKSEGDLDGQGSPRRIFVEVEITYPLGVGITDTPDHPLDLATGLGHVDPGMPDDIYFGPDETLGATSTLVQTSTSQRPLDMEDPMAPAFRHGYREANLQYVAGKDGGGSPIGSPDNPDDPNDPHWETIVSRNIRELVFPRRIYGANDPGILNNTTVTDAVTGAAKIIHEDGTEYGSSSRMVRIKDGAAGGADLSGAQTLCSVKYFAQDPIPNYGNVGYQVALYYRSNAPQTSGVKKGEMLTTTDGCLPTKIELEPLLMADNLWTGQVGMGSVDIGYPYVAPLDQIPVNDGVDPVPESDWVAGNTEEWFYCATANTTIDDFDADTGLLNLHSFVQADGTNTFTFGGDEFHQKPRKDAEFRSYYPFADINTYRPTAMSQPMSGAIRHKVFMPFLARVVKDQPGVDGGLLFRKNELVMVVLNRHAVLDEDNSVRFADPDNENRTCAAIYKTKNLLLTVGK